MHVVPMPFPLFSDFGSFYFVIFSSQSHTFIHLFGSHVAVLKFGQTVIVYAKDRDRDKQTNRQEEWEIDRHNSTFC